MSKVHLHFIGSTTDTDLRPIRKQRSAGDKEVEEVERDYSKMKEHLATDLGHFVNAVLVYREQKNAVAEKYDIDTPVIDKLSSYYLSLKLFGHPGSTWQKGIQSYFPSLIFTRFKNLNRDLIVRISGEDLDRFVSVMKEIVTHSPAHVFPKQYSYLKLVRSFSFFEAKDRVQKILEDLMVKGDLPSKIAFRLFDIDEDKLREIINFIEDFAEIESEQNKLFREIKPKTSIISIEDLIEIITTIVDDTSMISSNFTYFEVGEDGKKRILTHVGMSSEFDPTKSLETVAVIDSGISSNNPILMTITDANKSLSLIDDQPLLDACLNGGHGTAVASLVAFDSQLKKDEGDGGLFPIPLLPDAKLISVKLFTEGSNKLEYSTLPKLINDLHAGGVRLFNFSGNYTSALQEDNASVSEFGYWLDYELAKKQNENALLIASVGNFEWASPQFSSFGGHASYAEQSNLTAPADANNILSIGAIDSNNYHSWLSRKGAVDYACPIDFKGTLAFSVARKARKKPDLVHLGVDVPCLSADFEGEEVIEKTGTSFSTPLITNIAASIWNKYPQAKANTIKALIVSSACDTELKIAAEEDLESAILPEKILDRKRSEGDDHLRMEAEGIRLRCLGYGFPKKEEAIYSDASRVTIIFEDQIEIDIQKTFKLNLPKNFNLFDGEGRFNISSSLVFNHIPIFSDHLNYNPLNISYRIISHKDACDKLEDDIEDHKERIKDEPQNLAALEQQIKVLSDIRDGYVVHSWSQDNLQRLMYSNIQRNGQGTNYYKSTLNKCTKESVGDLYIQVRCNLTTTQVDSNVFKELSEFFEREEGVILTTFEELVAHYKPSYSLVITLEDTSSQNRVDFYDHLLTANAETLVPFEATVEAEVDV